MKLDRAKVTRHVTSQLEKQKHGGAIEGYARQIQPALDKLDFDNGTKQALLEIFFQTMNVSVQASVQLACDLIEEVHND